MKFELVVISEDINYQLNYYWNIAALIIPPVFSNFFSIDKPPIRSLKIV